MNGRVGWLAQLYDAIGDRERWAELEARIAGGRLPPELASHLARARRTHDEHMKLSADLDLFARVEDGLNLGLLVVDARGRLLRANRAALRCLRASLGLHLEEGHIRANAPAEQAQLVDRLGRHASTVAGAESASFLQFSRSGHRPLGLVVLSAGGRSESVFDVEPVACLLLIDPDAPGIPARRILSQLFGFTPREAQLAELLAGGRALPEAAQTMGIAASTARTFLSQLLAKTGTARQGQLVLRLLSLPGLAAVGPGRAEETRARR